MKKITKLLCSTDAFRCVFLLLMVFSPIYKLSSVVGPFVKFIVLPWGYFLLLRDLLGKRVLFKMKYIWILIAFLGLYAATILLNRAYLTANIKIYVYMVLHLLLLYPSDPDIPRKNKYRTIFIFNSIFILPATVMSTASVWAQLTQFSLEIDGILFGQSPDYQRLTGFYLNSNTGGMVSFIAIAMLLINWTLFDNLSLGGAVKHIGKAVSSVFILIHMAMLTLSGSRASRYSLLVFILIFSFVLFARIFSRRTSYAVSGISAMLAAVVLTGAVYAADRPIRVGIAQIQSGTPGNYGQEAALAAAPGLLRITPPHALMAIEPAGTELMIIERIDAGKSNDIRLSFWRMGLEIIADKPLLGVSPAGLMDKALELNSLKPEGEGASSGLITDISGSGLHNLYIQLAATNGIPGFVLFMAFLFLFSLNSLKKLFTALQSRSSPAAAAILALCAALLFLNLFEVSIFLVTMYSSVILWSGLSFAASLTDDEEMESGADSKA